jgi:hypothetical protein
MNKEWVARRGFEVLVALRWWGLEWQEETGGHWAISNS